MVTSSVISRSLRVTLGSSSKAQMRRGAAALASFTVAGAACQGYSVFSEWKGTLMWRCEPCLGPTKGVERFLASSERQRLTVSGPARCEEAQGRKNTLVVFLGDSLVAGVGAGQEKSKDSLPAALPSSVAKTLAGLTESEVSWTSVGIVGAGVEQIRTEGMPKLRDLLTNFGEQHDNVVVVLVVGVNDLRIGNLWNYRSQLRELVSDLKHVSSKERAVDAVFLPQFDLCGSPLLQRYPLRFFLQPIWTFWEWEKSKAIADQHHASMLEAADSAETDVFCGDEMHPSLRGYQVWADSLAQQIQRHLVKRKEIVKETAELAAERLRAEHRHLQEGLKRVRQIFSRVDVC